MPEEIVLTPEQWQAALEAQMAKMAPKTPARASVPSTKPAWSEKSFVSFHYAASGDHPDGDSQFGKRSLNLYVQLHFFTREGDSFGKVANDARNYAQMFPHSSLVVHDHAWNEPCKAPAKNKCKEI